MTSNEVKEVWEQRAVDPQFTPATITFNDYFYREVEIKVIEDIAKLGQWNSLLDIGCGNGYTTVKLAPYFEHIVGTDYSEKMIARAEKDYGTGLCKNITWKVVDVLNMNEGKRYDCILSSRCLINLVSWEDQLKALENITNHLKVGGTFIMVECSQQGRDDLNNFRAKCGLARIPRVPFNLDFDETKLWLHISKRYDISQVHRFGMYEVISKVLHPLFVAPLEPSYAHGINFHASNMAYNWEGSSDMDELNKMSHEFVATLVKTC
jgi:ubiquinone/menaquinone biosynthesis C-methylase UbiE